jgi:hypothetical protein
MKRNKKQIVKMNLSLDKDFYVLLQEKARADYMRVSTWTKQLLMRSLLEKNNDDTKCLTKNGSTMGLQQ